MAQDETAPEGPEARSPATETQDRGIFVPLIFGGAVAAGLGFFGSQIDSIERALGLAPPENGVQEAVDAQAARLEEQAERIAAQEQKISALTEQVETFPEPPPPPDLSGIEGQLSDQSARLDALAQRLEDVEKRPMTEGLSEDAIAAYEEELARLQSAVEEQRSEIETILEDARQSETAAERSARMADARTAAARIIAALDNGDPFAEELSTLQQVEGADVPDILSETAADGVATLGALQASFPPAARDGLAAARAQQAASGEGGLAAFLERQLGARSVTPQEGDDPDAVLSRAEAAVQQGRLGDALSEMETLPEDARSAMADWISQAETRNAATRAARDVMAALGTN